MLKLPSPIVFALFASLYLVQDSVAQIQSPLLEHASAHVEKRMSEIGTPQEVMVLDDGFESFVLRVHLVRTAKKSIDIQTFIWGDDETSHYFANELIQAARRGVKVRVLADYMWSAKDPERLAWNMDGLDGIELKVYRPVARSLDPSFVRKVFNFMTPNNTNQRMHNKLMLVDGVIGITGGRNAGNNYFDYSTGYNFKDREIMAIGPAVTAMTDSFEVYWDFRHSHLTSEFRDVVRARATDSSLEEELMTISRIPYFQSLDEYANDQDHVAREFVMPLMPVDRVEFVADKPGRKTWSYYFSQRGGGALTESMREQWSKSEGTVLIQSPYSILNRRTRRMIRNAQRRAPSLLVKVSTNSFGAADHLETYSANYRLRTKVIRGLGFEVYEYKPHPEDLNVYLANYGDLKNRAEDAGRRRSPYLSIHSKTFTFGGKTTFIGTYNLDPRSFYVNSECGVFVHDEDFARDVEQRLLRDMSPENSWVIARKEQPLSGVNLTIEGISSLLPVDLWPIRYTSSFELKEGEDAVHVDHPEFYDRYRDLGSFPGSEGLGLDVSITKMYKRFGKAATPLL